MGIATRQRRVATAWTALLVVGAVLVLFDLARVVLLDLAGSDRPSDRRCAELWNGPANRTNRSLVRGRAFPLATVWASNPTRPGSKAVWCCCGRVRMDLGWCSAPPSPRPRWAGTVA